MRRRHLFEWEDQPWCPAVIRDGGMAFLELAERLSGQSRLLAGPLVRALDASGQTEVVDLCWGGGTPAVSIAKETRSRGRAVIVALTDL